MLFSCQLYHEKKKRVDVGALLRIESIEIKVQ